MSSPSRHPLILCLWQLLLSSKRPNARCSISALSTVYLNGQASRQAQAPSHFASNTGPATFRCTAPATRRTLLVFQRLRQGPHELGVKNKFKRGVVAAEGARVSGGSDAWEDCSCHSHAQVICSRGRVLAGGEAQHVLHPRQHVGELALHWHSQRSSAARGWCDAGAP